MASKTCRPRSNRSGFHFLSSLPVADQRMEVSRLTQQLVWIPEHDEGWRDMNMDLYERVQMGENEIMDQSYFLNDDIFCEYGYLADFEKRQVEVHCYGYAWTWDFAKLQVNCFNNVAAVADERDAEERQERVAKEKAGKETQQTPVTATEGEAPEETALSDETQRQVPKEETK